MQCPKCKNEDMTQMAIVKANMHNKLVCTRCLAYIKFLSKAETKTFLEITGQKELEEMPAAPAREGDLWDLCHA